MRRRRTGRRTGAGTARLPNLESVLRAGPSGWRRTVAGGLLWGGAAAALGASGDRTARRAPCGGIGTVAIASAVTRAVARPAVRRAQPLNAAGRIASAAAFAAGVLLEAPRYGLLRGAGRRRTDRGADALRGPSPGRRGRGRRDRSRRRRADRPLVAGQTGGRRGRGAAAPPAPALPGGAGLHIVVNTSSGLSWSADGPDASDYLRAALPKADITVAQQGQGLTELLEEAARRAKEQGGALGACGGDGTINAATEVAARVGVPLAVFPGGTFNHFAVDLGNQSLEDVVGAVQAGEAVVADLGRPACRADRSRCSSTPSASASTRSWSAPARSWRNGSGSGRRSWSAWPVSSPRAAP
ncbi:diacylglycerol/lipid kinase family protein [Streptomyces sp. LN325]|uniref:diacylglycerol/lipid kinase family protein n=1 Tax=Streptomyces sp. LN325 TaxID=3112976 RepID=UPI0037216CEA